MHHCKPLPNLYTTYYFFLVAFDGAKVAVFGEIKFSQLCRKFSNLSKLHRNDYIFV